MQAVLDGHRAFHGLYDVVKRDQHRIARRLHKPAAMPADGWREHGAAQVAQTHDRPDVIEGEQAAVAHHIRMYGRQQAAGPATLRPKPIGQAKRPARGGPPRPAVPDV
jgi:hypothetical protein